jgi:general secretion pathway protein F
MNTVLREYRYRALSQGGKISDGTVQANSRREGEEIIWARGLTPMEIYRAGQNEAVPWWRREIGFTRLPSAKAVTRFTREFAILLDAGIALDVALRLLTQQTACRSMRAAVQQLLTSVRDGSPISDSLGNQSAIFKPDYLTIVRAGEQAGTLALAFTEIADLLEKRTAIRDRIRSALIYPCFLLFMAALSVFVIFRILAPAIAPIFAQNGLKPPFIIALYLWLQNNWLPTAAIFAGLMLFLLFFIIAVYRSNRCRIVASRFALGAPLVGQMLLLYHTERFTRTFGALLRAGVPITQAFASASDIVRNRHLRAGLGKALAALREGATLAHALSMHSGFSQSAVQMIAIGEASARLEDMLQRLATNLAYTGQQRIDRLLIVLTPALTITIAVVIGAIIFTTMNAVLSINELAVR